MTSFEFSNIWNITFRIGVFNKHLLTNILFRMEDCCFSSFIPVLGGHLISLVPQVPVFLEKN